MATKITQFGPVPQRNEAATFSDRADKFVKQMLVFVNEINTLAQELEDFSKNVSDKSADTDKKYSDLVTKYKDFITKYTDFFKKYDDFSPKYDDTVIKYEDVVNTATSHKTYVDTTRAQIIEALIEAKSYINSSNGDIIDDGKTSKVSTFSSQFIKENIQSKMNEFLDLLFIDAIDKFSDELERKRQKVGEIVCTVTANTPPYTKPQNELFSRHRHAFLFRVVNKRKVQMVGDENFIFINAQNQNLIYTGVKND